MKPAWPKRVPRKRRSDLGVTKAKSADPVNAVPASRDVTSLKWPAHRESRTDKRPRLEDRQPACTPASRPPELVDDRFGHPWPLSRRIAAGRTHKRLRHLAELHLFSPPTSFVQGVTAAPGVSATYAGLPVFIIGVFTRRGVRMADVLTLEQLPHDATTSEVETVYRARKLDIHSCKVSALTEIGNIQYRPLSSKRKDGWVRFAAAGADDRAASCSAAQLARSLRASACTFNDNANTSDLCLQVSAVLPLAAREHVASTEHEGHRHTVAVRADVRYGLQFVLAMPLPIQVDCRPWRCVTCMQMVISRAFSVLPSDMQAKLPDVLYCRPTAQERECFFTRSFLLWATELFASTLNSRALRRSIIDYFTTNCLALAGGVRGLWFISAVPRPNMLRHMLCLALESYLPGLVTYMKKSIHVFSGSARKYDGNYKMAARVAIVGRDAETRRWRLTRPYTVLHGFNGIDGALLTPVTLGRAEAWADIKAELEKLEDEVEANRIEAGLPMQAIPPVSHSTDTYGKHRLKLHRLYQQKYCHLNMSVCAPTPRSNAIGAVTTEGDSGVCPTVITGEPCHEVIAFRALVSPSANDCVIMLKDHECAMSRLSAVPAPSIPLSVASELPRDLQSSAHFLLRAAVRRSADESRALLRAHPDATAEVKCFLEQPFVDKSSTWKTRFHVIPPCGTFLRLGRFFGATLHSSVAFFNYKDRLAHELALLALSMLVSGSTMLVTSIMILFVTFSLLFYSDFCFLQRHYNASKSKLLQYCYNPVIAMLQRHQQGIHNATTMLVRGAA